MTVADVAVDARRATQLERVARGSAASFLGSALTSGIEFGVILLLTHSLTSAGLGSIIEAVAVFNIAMFLATIGTDTSLVREVSRYRVVGRQSEVRTLLKRALVPVTLVGLGFSLIVLVLADTLAELFGSEETAVVVAENLRTVAPLIALGAVGQSLLAATRGFSTMIPTVIVDRIARPLLQVVAVVVVLVAAGSFLDKANEPRLATVALAWIAGFAMTAFLGAYALRHLLLDPPPVDEPVVEGPAPSFWLFTLPEAAANALRVLLRWQDTLFVGAFLGASAAAIYTASTRLLKLGGFVNQAVYQSTMPMVSESFARGDVVGAGDLYRSVTRWLAVAAWPVYLAIAWWAEAVLGIFGSEYTSAAPAVRILTIGFLVASACGPVEAVLLMAGRSGQNLGLNMASVALNALLNVLLIPPFGLEGAALAWSAALLVTNLGPMALLYRDYRIQPAGREWLLLLLVLAASYGIPGLLLKSWKAPALGIVVGALAVSTAWAGSWVFLRRNQLKIGLLIGRGR
ncbi:MAG: oligosaccharide flippase family protein [Actinomycetia bacterium]|nr:oligosaccharide flippase family protein [Actinomycetes bacterium]